MWLVYSVPLDFGVLKLMFTFSLSTVLTLALVNILVISWLISMLNFSDSCKTFFAISANMYRSSLETALILNPVSILPLKRICSAAFIIFLVFHDVGTSNWKRIGTVFWSEIKQKNCETFFLFSKNNGRYFDVFTSHNF